MGETNVVNLGSAAAALRDEFIAWQCRLRRHAMRELGGRPSEGMRPAALDAAGGPIADAITVLMARTDSASVARLLEFQFKRTQDPLDRYEKAVTAFSADFYQHPADFSGVMTGLFNEESRTLRELLESSGDVLSPGRCVLLFHERSRAYRLPCDVERLAPDAVLFRSTYWHNALFNPNLPPDIAVLAFVPDWLHASRQHDM
jgi:hypothetical protein